jgi:uncharacterized protein
MVARLSRWLRLIGADVICDPALDGAALLRIARGQGRIMLTRDKRFKSAAGVVLIESNDFRAQLRQVLVRFGIDPRRRAFTRCLNCNQPLAIVTREAVSRRVPPFVYASAAGFAQCDRCGKIYWRATHPQRALRELDALGI